MSDAASSQEPQASRRLEALPGGTRHISSIRPTSSDEARRMRYRERREQMLQSAAGRRAVRSLSLLALFVGHARPVSHVASWALQTPAMPGDSTAPIVATAVGVAEQMLDLFGTEHPLSSMPQRLPPDVDAAIRWQCDRFRANEDVRDARNEAWESFSRCASDLEWWSAKLGELSPPFIARSTPPLPHYALFECATVACGLPDLRLGEDLVCGAPCIGDIPDSGNFALCHDPQSVNIDELEGHHVWHSSIVHQLTEAGTDPDRATEHADLWARTTKEVVDGYAVEIGTLDDTRTFFGGDGWRASVRFAVHQKGKIRPCDNCRVSLHNLATSMAERLINESADFPARVASLYAEILADDVFAMLIGTEDIAAAYRRMACSQPWYTVFAQWDPHRQAVIFFRLQGFNFGLRSAPNQFNRLSFAMARFASRLLRVACNNYLCALARRARTATHPLSP
jgi:hypothetical protein